MTIALKSQPPRAADHMAQRLIGECPPLRQLREAVVRAAPLTAPVLVEGETGTGKEIVAQLLHEYSHRRGPFVPVNVAELRQDMAEAELFGTVRGAFTDAADRLGRFEAADGGTLLLDETADLPRPLQARLLRVLETGVFNRIGETRERSASFRLVMTVQTSPGQLVQDGRWRPDFLYRVGRLHLTIPALTRRGSDLILLTNSFLQSSGEMALESGTQAELYSYHWPGNVRELAHAVERAVFMSSGRRVEARDIVAAARTLAPSTTPGASEHALAAAVRSRSEGLGRTEAIRSAERAHVEEVLKEHEYRVRPTAVALGMSRAHLYRRLRALGIALPESAAN